MEADASTTMLGAVAPGISTALSVGAMVFPSSDDPPVGSTPLPTAASATATAASLVPDPAHIVPEVDLYAELLRLSPPLPMGATLVPVLGQDPPLKVATAPLAARQHHQHHQHCTPPPVPFLSYLALELNKITIKHPAPP